jgi:hypothetical protein
MALQRLRVGDSSGPSPKSATHIASPRGKYAVGPLIQICDAGILGSSLLRYLKRSMFLLYSRGSQTNPEFS